MLENNWEELRLFQKEKRELLNERPSDHNNLREWIEMFAAILWHLEMAYELPDEIPTKPMREYRKDLIKSTGHVAWTLWMESRSKLTYKRSDKQLISSQEFESSPSPETLYALQSTLIGDAAIRLGGLYGLIREHHRHDEQRFDSAGALPLRWDDKTLETNWRNESAKQLAIVIVYRDMYMHGEDTGKRKPKERLVKLKTALDAEYSLKDVFDACVAVWDDIFSYYKVIAP